MPIPSRLSFALIGVLILAATGARCGPPLDLSQALEVTDVNTGWYDDGLLNGVSHILPSISFRLHNRSNDAINGVQLTVSFWRDGEDGEWDSLQMRGIGSQSLASGASTDILVARPAHGYTVEGLRADMFTNHSFHDAMAKIFALRGGKIFRMGEHRLDRKLIPHQPATH